MHILTVPQDTATLRQKSVPVTDVTPELVALLRDLGETLKNQRDPQGVGLSAVQVGRPIRGFAMWLPREGPRAKGQGLREKKNDSRIANNELLFYLNPEIVDRSKETTLGEDLVESNQRPGHQAPGLRPESSTLRVLRPEGLRPRGTRHLKPFLEGCLSIPRIYGPVPRWEWIEVRAVALTESDVSSSRFTLHASLFTLEKLASRVFQHELDHLNGILFTDRTLEAGLPLYESKEGELVPMEM